MTNDFWNDDHEELFYMFVAEFIGWCASEYILNVFEMEFSFANRLLDLFPREVCEEEFEGEVYKSIFNYTSRTGHIEVTISKPQGTGKIKFRFED